MRVLGACSIGGSGHLHPLLPLLDAARDAGHETLVVAPRSMAAQVTRSGHEFAQGDDPPAEELARIRDALPLAPPDEAAVLGNRDLFGRLAARAMLPALERVLDGWRPTLVLREPCEYASALLAPSRGIRTAQVAIDLAEVEWRSLEIAAPALAELGSHVEEEIRASPYVTRFPAVLDPSPFRDTRRFSESLSLPDGHVPDWWSGSHAPLVYMTLGSVLGHLPGAEPAYNTLLAAVADTPDIRVLLTVGTTFDLGRLASTPRHVHAEAWVDQAAVLPSAALVVCHGGSGTVFGALAAGCPLVVVPLFVGGQFSNAAKVQASGAGVKVSLGGGGGGERRPLELSDAPSIRRAIDVVRTEPSYALAARRIAADMSAAAPPTEILAALLK